MNKRLVYKVRYDKAEDLWWTVSPDGDRIDHFTSKTEAVRYGAGEARDHHKAFGTLTQLRVHNKNGRIAFERTYGKDPVRRKG